MVRISRRRLFWLLGGSAVAVVGVRFGLPLFLRPIPPRTLDDDLQAFVDGCMAGIDGSRIVDTHVHLIGLGAGGTGCWLNPEMQSHLHPLKRLQYDVYVSSLGMTDPDTADADYVARLEELTLQAYPEGRLLLMAFDHVVDEAGVEQPEHSPFYTPNDYVFQVADAHPAFLPCASIHPYRADAIDRLDEALERGARAIKWLPNAMGIDPALPRCRPFYRRLADAGIPLISHGGREYAVDAAAAQELGNPQRLRVALDDGVTVIVAHCASLGSVRDLDRSDEADSQPAFDLFLKMLDVPDWNGRLYGDISALTQLNRGVGELKRLIEAEHLHDRLVNGSDYPIPALRILYSTTRFLLEGMLTDEQRLQINDLSMINPLLFDLTLKRSLRLRVGGREFRFSDSIFETARLFRRRV